MLVLDANDREVIEACQRGDSDAFRVLFEAHKDRVYSIALRYSGDPAAAMDIAQESFLKVLALSGNFEPRPGLNPGSTGLSSTPAWITSAAAAG